MKLDRSLLGVSFPVIPGSDQPLEIVRTTQVRSSHPTELGLFARHEDIPAHDQEALQAGHPLIIGCGGLNFPVAVGLMRSGVKRITLVDGDLVDLTNLSRQLYTQDDLGLPKGKRLAIRVAEHAVGGAVITGVGLSFNEALEKYPLPADLIIAGVDNNSCRLEVALEARRRKVPAIFSMLSLDGMRCQIFLQGGSPLDPCLFCALPNLDPERTTPCAAAIISSCFMAAGFTLFFAHRALMGWGSLKPFNWREADLTGIAPDRTGLVRKRPDCTVCSS